jgi:hypothetical protein
VEWFVGAFVVLGLIAVVVRFVLRDAEGVTHLPRIVDDSVGMYTLRRFTGLPLGNQAAVSERDWFGRDVGVRRFEPAPLRRRTPGPIPVSLTGYVVSEAPAEPRQTVEPTVLARTAQPATQAVGRATNHRPAAARRPALSTVPLRLALVVAVAIMGFGVGVVLGQPTPQGQVLGATGTPEVGEPSVLGPSRFPAIPGSAGPSGSPPQN